MKNNLLSLFQEVKYESKYTHLFATVSLTYECSSSKAHWLNPNYQHYAFLEEGKPNLHTYAISSIE
jgi:hypothetical protein